MKHQKGEILLTALLIGTLVAGALAAFTGYKIDKYKEVKKNQELLAEYNLGAFRPSNYVGKLLTRLNEGGAESTFNTTPGTAADGSTLTTAKLGDFMVFTINPGAANEEKISVSAVSVSGTTATWTIINRGLSYTENAAVTANKKQHAIGETVIISNDDHYINVQYVNKDDAETIVGIKTFSSPPLVASSTTFTASNQVINKQYADDLAIAGAPDSSLTVKGLVEIATSSELAEGTSAGGTTAPLVARSTSFSSTTSAAVLVPVTQSNGKLKQGWLDLTEEFSFSGGLRTTSSTISTSTVNGTMTFTTNPNLASSTPTGVNEATRKDYVDDVARMTYGTVTFATSSANATVDIDESIITISLKRASRVLLSLVGYLELDGVAGQTCEAQFNIDNDTTILSGPYLGLSGTGSFGGGTDYRFPMGGSVVTDVLTAGTHTFRVRLSVSDVGSNDCSVSGRLTATSLTSS